MNIAIIGFGRAGQVHLTAARQAHGIDTIAVCDPSPERRNAAEALDLRTYATVHEMLANENIEAAVIATPPRQHVAAAMACLAHGVHVLCEKPLALSSSEAAAMFDAANHRTLLAVASKFRHVEELRHVRALLRSGALGDPVGFHVSFRSVVDMSQRWNSHPEQSGGGVIADNASHVFDILTYLFGPLASVRAHSLTPLQPLQAEDSATLQIEMDDDIVGTAELSWSLPPAGDTYVSVQGTNGIAFIGWKHSLLKHKGRGWQSFGTPYDRDRAHRDMHRVFAAAIDDRNAIWISQKECLQAVGAVEACYRSLRSGKSEAVSPAHTPINDGAAVMTLGAEPAGAA